MAVRFLAFSAKLVRRPPSFHPAGPCRLATCRRNLSSWDSRLRLRRKLQTLLGPRGGSHSSVYSQIRSAAPVGQLAERLILVQ